MPDLPTPREKPDAYTARYMSGPGRGLYHDKIVAPAWFRLLLLLPILILVASAVSAHAPATMLGGLPVILVWILFSVLRVSVSEGELHVQYGLFGPKVPIADILSCEAVDYDWKKYGGWGIRRGFDGSVAYNMVGDRGRAVRVVYRKGRWTKTILVATRDPDRLALAVQQARVLAAAKAFTEGDPRLRVKPAPDEIDAEAEREAEAALHDEDRHGRA